jgi:hypothetical protein
MKLLQKIRALTCTGKNRVNLEPGSWELHIISSAAKVGVAKMPVSIYQTSCDQITCLPCSLTQYIVAAGIV